MGTMRAGIIGAGIGGLSAALALRQAGYAVTLFEQAARIAPMGAALSLWENAILALRELGAAERIEREAAPIERVSVHDRRGKVLMRSVASKLAADGTVLARLPTRALVQTALLACLAEPDLRLGARIAEVDQTGDTAIIRTEDGITHSFDLVVAADGLRSQVGARLIGTPVRHAGYGGFLALSEGVGDIGDRLADNELREYWAPHLRFGIGDIGGEAGAHRRYWFYMPNEKVAGEWSAMDLTAIRQSLSDWPPEIAAVLAATPPERLIPFSIHDRPAPRRLGKGRIVCLGDAAHAMQPNLGQGACQAIEDALALREAAKCAAPQDILGVYSALRLQRVRQIVRASADAGWTSHGSPRPLAHMMQQACAWIPDRALTATFARARTLPDYLMQGIEHR